MAVVDSEMHRRWIISDAVPSESEFATILGVLGRVGCHNFQVGCVGVGRKAESCGHARRVDGLAMAHDCTVMVDVDKVPMQ